MKITIFTPTYNRKNTLHRLYKSLLNQTSTLFEWLIVDDGSTDGTDECVKKLINENKVRIRYYYQKNAGKPQAHNKGVELTETELFVCVDSDDYLAPDAVERIIQTWKMKKTNDSIGILAYKVCVDGKSVTGIRDKNVELSTLKDAYDNYGLTGDTMLVYEAKTIKCVSFPNYEGEKFVPEAYLYDRLDQLGKLIILRENLYICEYLEGGYTANIAKLLVRNKCGTMAYINQRLKVDKTLKQKALDTIRYIAIAIAVGEKGIIRQSVYRYLTVLLYPLGYIFYIKRYKKIKGE